MEQSRQSFRRIALTVVGLILLARFGHFVAQHTSFGFLNMAGNFWRIFIYIGLFSAWGVSVQRRVMQVQARRILLAVSVLMVFWLVVREFKWHLIARQDVCRWLWYLYYVPMLLIPFCALRVSLTLGKPEEYRLPRYATAMFLPVIFLIGLVLTNDLHQLVFVFPDLGTVWQEEVYSYGIGFLFVAAGMLLCSAAALLVMLAKARVPRTRRLIWLPILPVGAVIVYTILYAVRLPIIQTLFDDVVIINCLFFSAFFECCIECGLIASNMRYAELFLSSVNMPMQITDTNYRLYAAAGSVQPVAPETMRRAEKEPVILPDGRRLHNMPIPGGHAVWTEDVSALLRLKETLEDRREELRERNALLQYEYDREQEHKIVEEQNRLYDLLQSKTQKQIDKINRLVQQYQQSHSKAEKEKILACIVILGSFIKRRKDFVLSVDSTPTLPQTKLNSALGESFRAMRLLEIQGDYLVDTGRDYLNGETMTLAYDFFEDVLESVLQTVRFLSVRVCTVHGMLRISILTDTAPSTKAFLSAYKKAEIICDADGTTFWMPIEEEAI